MILILTFQCDQYEESKSRLLLLSLDKMHAESERNDNVLEFNASEKSRLLSAVVDLDARQAVCAAGNLMVHSLAYMIHCIAFVLCTRDKHLPPTVS